MCSIGASKEANKFVFLGLALLSFVVFFLEILVLLIGSLFRGDAILWELPSALIVHWVCTIVFWCLGFFALHVLAKKSGYDMFAHKDKPKPLNWVFVGIIFAISIIVSYISWDMRFKPLAEFIGFVTGHGDIGILLFVFQYIYILAESALILATVIFGQEFGERAFKNKAMPWGGIFCGLTWGLVHILTQDLFTGILGAVVAAAYGAVFLLLRKNIRYAYIVIALMFMI